MEKSSEKSLRWTNRYFFIIYGFVIAVIVAVFCLNTIELMKREG